jgi:predicted nucleotidyltransferase component of viral defense system
MKEYLLQLVSEAQDRLHGRHIAREYLQARILQSLQRTGAMVPLAFHGGTALRFLYQIPRFSEDLDFALEQAPDQYNFRTYLKAVRADLAAENYPVEVRVNDQRVVHSAFVRFRGLLRELGLSPHGGEVLAIKLEVDTRPPAGATLDATLVRRYALLNLQHHDKASLLAGKVHAILQRPYTKGRDLYDLFWYLSDPNWPPPNLVLLNNALKQTGWQHTPLTENNWRGAISQQLAKMDWEKAVVEVRPFLMVPGEVELLTFENLTRLLSGVE